MANAYGSKHDYRSGIQAYNKVLALTGNYPGFVVQKGILFEKINEVDSAKNMYAFARKLYSKKLSASPNDIDAIKGSIYLKALTISKDSAIDELNKQIKIHPDFAAKLATERYLYDTFDRKAITGHTTL